MRQLMTEFRNHRTFTAPWNRKLKYAFNMNPVAEWEEDRPIDLEYHVRHAALPWPGGERELGERVGRLQSTPIDLARPPWECTIIEGLEGNRFALFIKMHHSLIDGVSGVKLLQRAMASTAAEILELPPFWASGMAPRTRRGQRHQLHHLHAGRRHHLHAGRRHRRPAGAARRHPRVGQARKEHVQSLPRQAMMQYTVLLMAPTILRHRLAHTADVQHHHLQRAGAGQAVVFPRR